MIACGRPTSPPVEIAAKQMDKAEGETLRAKLMEARTLLDDLMAERNEMEAAQVVANGTHPFLKYSDS